MSESGVGKEIGDTQSTMQIGGQILDLSKRFIFKCRGSIAVPFWRHEIAETEQHGKKLSS